VKLRVEPRVELRVELRVLPWAHYLVWE